jgi:hypothetical protein
VTTLLAILGVIALYYWWRQARQSRFMREARHHLRRFRRQPHIDAYDVSDVDLELQEHMNTCLESLAFYVDEGRIPWLKEDQATEDLRFVASVVGGNVSDCARQGFRALFIDDLFSKMQEEVQVEADSLYNPVGCLKWMIPLGHKALAWRADGEKISFKTARRILRKAEGLLAADQSRPRPGAKEAP